MTASHRRLAAEGPASAVPARGPRRHYAKLTAFDAIRAGVFAAEEVEDAKAQLPHSVFRKLYLAEPGNDETCPFNAAAVRACTGTLSTQPPTFWVRDLAKSVH